MSRKQHRNQRRPGVGERSDSNLDHDDAMAELRAVRNPNSRRGQTSITHLLNYSAPRPYVDHHSVRSYRRNPTWGSGSGYHAADKARYVHANYRFVVSPEGAYEKHEVDADAHLDWNSVMQVIASSESQATSCPICLSEPVAPRMAKCGHIFCLPCMIRFQNSVSSEDEAKSGRGLRWKKCPICEDTIYLHEIRPVRFYAAQESPLPRIGDDVVLRLMARKANSTLALPREGAAEVLNSGDDIPWHFAANVLDYARIMKGTSNYMSEQFDEEVAALEKQAKEDEQLFGQDQEWSQKAIRAINQAKEKLAEVGTGSELGMKLSKPTSEADFYFYSSPPHLYLSPLDIRILKSKYGSFSAFPSTLLPRVEHISTGHVVDDVVRKRAKYLGHLPRGCIISFLECDWTDIVPAETLEAFATDIERRRKRNRDKETQEERERLQAERIEAAAMRGSAVSGEAEEDNAPFMDPADFQPLTSLSGSTPPDARPGFESLSDMSTSPSTQRTIWGTHILNAEPEMGVVQTAAGVDDGWLRDEEMFGTEELARQIEAIQVMENGGASSSKMGESSGGGGAGGRKKKKQKQKITLMSTGGRRGN